MRLVPLLLLCFVIGCGDPKNHDGVITLATTTSTRDSGLLDELLPMFEQRSGIRVKVVAVGSGQALEMGRRGDADVLLTHAPEAEKEFVAQGYGVERRLVMHNDFVLVGPKLNPPKLKEDQSITEAFREIARNEIPFVSRGDESATHMKEKSIWGKAKLAPQGDWYIKAGSGMGQTLRMASEKQALTLTDRGTFLSQRDKLDLVILSQGDPLLRNQYAVMVVSPEKHPHVNEHAAGAFAAFLLSPQAQEAIAEFGVEKFGEPLFFPNKAEPANGS